VPLLVEQVDLLLRMTVFVHGNELGMALLEC